MRDQYRMGETEWGLLGEVGDLHVPCRTVANGFPNLGLGVADDDADLPDACPCHRLDAVEEDRLVGNRHQLLGAGMGDGS